MARQNKHIRLQVAHKAAQMMSEEGISDYAFVASIAYTRYTSRLFSFNICFSFLHFAI